MRDESTRKWARSIARGPRSQPWSGGKHQRPHEARTSSLALGKNFAKFSLRKSTKTYFDFYFFKIQSNGERVPECITVATSTEEDQKNVPVVILERPMGSMPMIVHNIPTSLSPQVVVEGSNSNTRYSSLLLVFASRK